MSFDWIARIHTLVTRATPGPLLVRVAVAGTAGAALVIAYPHGVLAGKSLVVAAAVAAAPMVAPRGRVVTLVALAAVTGWLLSTMGYDEPVTLPRVFGIAATLYLMHSLAALAAVLPYDAVVAPEVLGRWVARALLVVAASAALSLVVVVVADAAHGSSLLASVAGLAVAVSVTALLTYLLHRPARQQPQSQ